MAMLAGPRVKQKISINPRGTNWSNDDSKFGQKIMEKFGWTKGKGLGAKEDGNTEHVKVSLKVDSKGVGCSKSYADNWIAHQDEFNELLSNLNQTGASETDEPKADNDKVQSLEVKSKTSRSRVHYMKFTKGKDLSSRSSADLDCIFGKRKSKSESNTPLTQSAENSGDEGSGDDVSHGINVVKSTDSVQQYFQRKMAELKKNREGSQSDLAKQDNYPIETTLTNKELGSDSDCDKPVSFKLGGDSSSDDDKKMKKKRKKKDKRRKIDEVVKEEIKPVEEKVKSSKKDKKRKKDEMLKENANEIDEEKELLKNKKGNNSYQEIDECGSITSKKSKRKRKSETYLDSKEEITDSVSCKKEKKKKKDNIHIETSKQDVGAISSMKDRKGRANTEEIKESVNESSDRKQTSSKKDKKKRKHAIEEEMVGISPKCKKGKMDVIHVSDSNKVGKKKEMDKPCVENINRVISEDVAVHTTTSLEEKQKLLEEKKSKMTDYVGNVAKAFKGSNITDIHGYGSSESLVVNLKKKKNKKKKR